VSAPHNQDLVSQGYDILVSLTERGHALQSAFGLRKDPYRTKAIDRVSIVGEVPAPALAGRALRDVLIDGRLCRRQTVRTVERN